MSIADTLIVFYSCSWSRFAIIWTFNILLSCFVYNASYFMTFITFKRNDLRTFHSAIARWLEWIWYIKNCWVVVLMFEPAHVPNRTHSGADKRRSGSLWRLVEPPFARSAWMSNRHLNLHYGCRHISLSCGFVRGAASHSEEAANMTDVNGRSNLFEVNAAQCPLNF